MKKTITSTFFLLILAGGYILYYNFYVLPKDVKKYESFMQKHVKDKEKKDKTTWQTKKNIQKEIWQSSNNERLHSKIIADEGLVGIERKEGKIQVQEKMKNIVCLIQESLSVNDQNEPFQELRVIKAPFGLYSYENHKFSSEKVFVDLYRIPTWKVASYPLKYPSYLHGRAYQVSIMFKEHSPHFEALTFKADIQPFEMLKFK